MMQVTMIASTEFHEDKARLHGWVESPSIDATSTERLTEFSGRLCYESFNRPNPATRHNIDYINNIIKQQHFSVMEHATASFYVDGVSRNMLLELERHRHLSFSVISTRFVDSSKARIVIPPALREVEDGEATLALDSDDIEQYCLTVEMLMNKGKTRKEAREAARWLLPGNLETKFVVSGNMRAFRDMLMKRYSVHADSEIREFATNVLHSLMYVAGALFQDFPNTPFE